MIIKEDLFEDENFIVHHDSPGIVSMVNSGPHSNFSTFMISSSPMPFFDYKYVAFAKVVQGQEIVDKISRLKCAFERPLIDVVIHSIKKIDF
jgi:peptidyl-prolyl isomerase H (cyclophilin H)